MSNKLIPMVEYVLTAWQKQTDIPNSCEHNTNQLRDIIDYANFLKQPLKLEMFIPCDKNGNVLEEFNASKHGLIGGEYYNEYNKALSKVLFKGFDLMDENKESYWLLKDPAKTDLVFIKEGFVTTSKVALNGCDIFTIEDLTNLNLELNNE